MIEDITLVEQTEKDILKYISRNNSNNHLPTEQEFVDNLGVSRVVVREALSRLRALGFLETKRRKGTVVVTPDIFGVVKTIIDSGLLDRDTLRDLYQLRLILEIGMADLLFMNKTEEQMALLEEIVTREVECEGRMNQATTDEQKFAVAKDLVDIDIEFHSMLFKMTGNKSLIDFQNILRHLFTIYFPKVKKDFHDRNVVSHVGLYNLLRKGTPDAFRMAMRLHLTTQYENMENTLDNLDSKEI